MNDRDRYVYVTKPRCPKCRSANLASYKSMPIEADGSRSRYTKCRACSWRFIIVVEDFAEDIQTLEKQGAHHAK